MAAKKPRPSWPAISDAEMTVLRTLWDGGPGTVREIQERLPRAEQEWAYTTVQTLLSRLEEKGYVAVARAGVAHTFCAARSREDLAGRRVDELIDSVLDGAVEPLLLRLVEQGRFTREEIARFKSLLEAAEKREKRPGKGGGKA